MPYFANLFSPLFVFIAVIFFTSKLASNSEIISMLAAGVSFKRLMRPYMISCVLISSLSFFLASYIIPHGTVVRQNFESMYKNKRLNTSADNVMLQVDRGVIAYIQHYDNNYKKGYGFSLDKFENKKLVSHLTAMEAQYDTISDSKYHWTVSNWKIREMRGLKEHITSGSKLDTMIVMEPTDLVYSKGQQETFTSPELKEYISKQIDRGSSNVVQYQVAVVTQAKGRYGYVFGHWLGTQFRLHPPANRIIHIRHQCRHATDAGSMDTKHHIRHRSILLLQKGTKLKC